MKVRTAKDLGVEDVMDLPTDEGGSTVPLREEPFVRRLLGTAADLARGD